MTALLLCNYRIEPLNHGFSTSRRREDRGRRCGVGLGDESRSAGASTHAGTRNDWSHKGPLLHEKPPRHLRMQALLDSPQQWGQLFGPHAGKKTSGAVSHWKETLQHDGWRLIDWFGGDRLIDWLIDLTVLSSYFFLPFFVDRLFFSSRRIWLVERRCKRRTPRSSRPWKKPAWTFGSSWKSGDRVIAWPSKRIPSPASKVCSSRWTTPKLPTE